MIENKVLENPKRRKIIAVLMKNKQRFFSVKELSLRTGLAKGRVRAVLQYLSKRRLLNQAGKHQQKYYQINTAAKIFSEFYRDLKVRKIDLSRDILSRAVLSAGAIKLALLSGVFVGLPKAQADLLLVGKIIPKRLEKCLEFMEKLTGHEINYAIFSEAEYLERLYGSDWFLREILDRSHVTIIDRISSAIERNEIRMGVVRMMG